MTQKFYLCADKKAFKYALKKYADEQTEVVFCDLRRDLDRACRLIFENIEKEFYVFGCCRTGYLKNDLKTFLSLAPRVYEGFYIPYAAELCGTQDKPEGVYITGKIVKHKGRYKLEQPE